MLHATTGETLHDECFKQNKARSCVQLGTGLWQTPARRPEAIAAFQKGCALKEPSACTLKNLQIGPAQTTAPVQSPKEPVPHSKLHVRAKGPGAYTVKRSEALEFASDLQASLKDVGVEATHDGYRIAELQPTSPIFAAGFRTGDEINEVNGYSIQTPTAAMAVLATLPVQDRFTIHYRRAGKAAQTSIYIED